ncbi:PP2C family protein-serine/threonine phosphatase [Spiroplasma endosymbiont of Aspidapion aeneum]|uniref:PP2C family protein-serine/threonine phosphatase n=1 Tax=Spiroplasma endosymbiont of Aspidapion aeneum TaxID=3066276 RepID=UPI00313ADA8D
MKFSFTKITDIGNYRKQNQDNLEFYTNKNDDALAIVCDGMGGHAKGEIASKIAVENFGKIFKKSSFTGLTKNEINRWLRATISEVLNDMVDYANLHPQTKDMGTTLTAVLFTGGFAYVVNIGDSRTYKLVEDRLYQVTQDQNLMNSTTPDEKEDIKMSGLYGYTNDVTFWKVLTSALGPNKTLKIDTYFIDQPYGLYMLTTDGVHDYIDDKIALVTLKNDTIKLKEKAKMLVEDAKDNGSTDNLSILMVNVTN